MAKTSGAASLGHSRDIVHPTWTAGPRQIALLVLCALGLGVWSVDARADDGGAANYVKLDATVTDTKGVSTDVTKFGFKFGANVLSCTRGDAQMEIPFRNVRSIDIGAYIPERGSSPATVTMRSGSRIDVQISRHEGTRYLGGATEFGSYRIRLEQIRRLVLRPLRRPAREVPSGGGTPQG